MVTSGINAFDFLRPEVRVDGATWPIAMTVLAVCWDQTTDYSTAEEQGPEGNLGFVVPPRITPLCWVRIYKAKGCGPLPA